MLGFYYFIDDCPDARLNVPEGMLTSGNAVFLSFISDGNFAESGMSNKLNEVAQKIKSTHPKVYVAYSVGGQLGSSSQSLYDYLSGASEDDIANTILSWKYADGIDWDIEPPSGGVAQKYGDQAMAQKLARVSQKVRAGGKGVTTAGFGAWTWDAQMSTLNGELIISGAIERYGVMVYPPAQGDASMAINYFVNDWNKGAQAGPSEVIGHGVASSSLAGGISGTASPADALTVARAYKGAGVSSAIVWMVKPDGCSNTGGWVVKNADLPQWAAVLDALRGGAHDAIAVTI